MQPIDYLRMFLFAMSLVGMAWSGIVAVVMWLRLINESQGTGWGAFGLTAVSVLCFLVAHRTHYLLFIL